MRLAIPLFLAAAAFADTVTLRDRTVIEGKVISDTATEVVINTYNSSMKPMTFGVKKFDKGQVAKVELTPPDPLRDYWEKSAVNRPDRAALLKHCIDHKLDVEAREEAAWVLVGDAQNAQARGVLGAAADALLKGSALHSADLRAKVADYGALDAAGRRTAFEAWKKDLGVTLPQAYFDRVARSLKQTKGLQEDVRLTYNTKKASGRYSLWVPEDYDPHRAYPLLVGLHGAVNGMGGVGNGKDFIKHFTPGAKDRGWILVCPTADPLPWTNKGDEFVLSVIAEIELMFNVDMNRVFLIGHSRGGMGTWYFGTAYPERFAAFAPAAGSGGGNAARAALFGTGMYIYHSEDDTTVECDDDRDSAQALQRSRVDFVYTEYEKEGHGWPRDVIEDTLVYFKRHHAMKRGSKAPEPVRGTRSSFAEPLWPDEAKYFPIEAAGTGKSELGKLVGDIETGGSLAERAATALIAMKDKACLGPLSKILLTPAATEDSRIQSARVLGAFKEPASASALGRALSDKSLKVRAAAARALALAGEPKDSLALAGALETLGKDFESAMKKDPGSQVWEDYQSTNAAFVVAMGALGEARVAGPVSAVAVKKILLATDLPKFSKGFDPELARKKAALEILAALPGLHEPKLKADIGAIKSKFSADAEVQRAATDAEGKL